MPRRLYPSHTGRFGGLNRQLLYARHRMNRFRDEAYGRNFPTMPEGVAGEEWHPEPYKTGEMWADVEQRLHDILRNPPKIHEDPQTDAERQSNFEAMFASNPQLIQEQMRGETLRAVSGGKAGEKEKADREKIFVKRMTLADARHKEWLRMKEVNQKNPNTFSKDEINTALESYNAALREAHKAGEAADYGDLSESYPELAASGLTKKMQETLDRKKEVRKAVSQRGDPLLNQVMGEMGLPDIAGGGIPPQKQLDALNAAGPKWDAMRERGEITKKEWEDAIDAIKKGETVQERTQIAAKTLIGEAAETLIEAVREPARLPQHLAGGPPEEPVGITGLPTPGQEMIGEGEEFNMAPIEGPEQYMESTPEQMSRIPQDRFDALNMKLFNRLPPREEIGRVPRRFSLDHRERARQRAGRRRRGGVKEE